MTIRASSDCACCLDATSVSVLQQLKTQDEMRSQELNWAPKAPKGQNLAPEVTKKQRSWKLHGVRKKQAGNLAFQFFRLLL